MNKISDFKMLEILQAAGVETAQTGNQTVCRCPICKRGETLEKGNHEAQVNSETLYCHCCQKAYSRTEIINGLDLYDILDIKKWDDNDNKVSSIIPRIKAEPDKPDKPVPAKAIPTVPKTIKKQTVFAYRDLDGKILYHRTRTDFSDGTKSVPYDDKPKNQPVIFYGLETLIDPENLNFIFFTEGAMCAESLRTGLKDTNAAEDTAVLGFDSSSEWEKIGTAAQDIILSKKIIIFADNDEPGKKKVEGLIKYLKKPVTVVDFYDKPQKYDIADWLSEDGGDIAGAMKKYERTVTPVVEPEPETEQPISMLELARKSNVADLFNKEIPPAKFNKIFPCGRLSLIAGDGGSGKTYFALYFSLLFVKENPGKTVFLLLAEDDEWTIKRRLERLVEHYPYLNSSNRLNIHYIADRDIEVVELDTFSKKIIYKEKSELRETIQSYDISIIDPLVNLLPTDENENFSAKEFCKLMKTFVWGTDKSLVFLHHVAKGDLKDLTSESLVSRKLTDPERAARALKIRGAGAFLNSSRYAIYVEKQENTAIVSCVKNNYGKPGKILSKLDLPEIETEQDENFPDSDSPVPVSNTSNKTFKENSNDKKDEDIPENWI